jgi:hypothetical protein
VYLHRIDADVAPVTKSGRLAMNTGTTVFDVSVSLDFAANTVPEGLYKVYVSAGFEIPGPAWAGIAGYGEGCTIRVFQPK